MIKTTLRKASAAVLALILAASLLPFTALAAPDPGFSASGGSVTAPLSPGSTVRVPVSCTANSGFITGGIDVSWNTDILKLKKVDFAGSFTASFSPAPITGSESKYYIPIGDPSALSDNVDTGLLFTLEFEILPGLAKDRECKITLSARAGSFWDADLDAVPATVSSGTVKLRAYEITSVELSGKKVAASVYALASATAVCAAYDSAGRMTEYRSLSVKGSKELTFAFSSVFASAKVFLLSADGAPLCPCEARP